MNFQYVVASLLNLTQFTENLHVSMCYKPPTLTPYQIKFAVCSAQWVWRWFSWRKLPAILTSFFYRAWKKGCFHYHVSPTPFLCSVTFSTMLVSSHCTPSRSANNYLVNIHIIETARIRLFNILLLISITYNMFSYIHSNPVSNKSRD